MACLESGSSCGNGQGMCSENLTCVCFDPGYVDVGDFFPSTGCRVHVITFQALWIWFAIIKGSIFVVSTISILIMKRKSAESQQWDLLISFMFWINSIIGMIFVAYQLNPLQPKIAIDFLPSLFYGLHHFFVYFILLIKPIFRSETSMSRFVVERSNRNIIPRYIRLSIPYHAFGFVSAACALIPVMQPQILAPLRETYLVLQMLICGSVCILTGYSSWKASIHFGQAISNPVVSNRNSLRRRIEKFAFRARVTFVFAFISLLATTVTLIVYVICESCAQAFLWAAIPILFVQSAIWALRTVVVSAFGSMKNRKLEKTLQRYVKENPASLKEDLQDGSSSPTLNNSHSISSSGKHKRHHHRTNQHKQTQIPGNWKKKGKPRVNMTAVEEVDYEGTVCLTNIEGLKFPMESKEEEEPSVEQMSKQKEEYDEDDEFSVEVSMDHRKTLDGTL